MKTAIIKRKFITIISILALVVAPTGLGISSAYADSASPSSLLDTQLKLGLSHSPLTYVALGDSVAAGLGLAQSPNATTQDVLCGRSPQAYSTTVAAALKLRLTASNVACSGATVANLTGSQSVNGTTIQSQLDAAYAPGSLPLLLTITIGANDVHYSDFVNECLTTVCGTPADAKAAAAYLAALKVSLQGALANIQSRNFGLAPVVVVTGYYQAVSSQCEADGIPASNTTWLNSETDALNKTIQDVTQQFYFTRFAPVNFTGHDICSATPWVQTPGDPAPFHPTATGQQVIAKAVLHSLGQ